MKLSNLRRDSEPNRKRRGRWIRSYMVFVLAPLLLGVLLFFATRYVVEEQIRARGELTVASFQAKISGIMKEAEMVASAILNDNEFRENSAAELQTWDNSLAVTNSLSEAKASSDFVDKVYVIDEKQGKIYSDDGAVFSMDSLDAIFQVNFLSGLDYKDVSGWNYVFYNSYAPPLYVTEIRSPESVERIGTILILLRKGDFLKLLYDTDADCFCLFNDNFSISTVMTTETVPDWRDPEAVSRLLGDKVECIYREGRDFTYMAAISKWSYYAPVRLVLIFFGVYFALILILGLWSVYSAYRRHKRRVESLIQTMPLDVAAGDTDEEIMGAVRDALEKYRDNDKSAEERNRAYTMRHLLLGHYKEITPELLAAAGIPEMTNGCYVATMFVSDYGNIGAGLMTDASPNLEEQDVVDLVFHSALKQIAGDHAKVASVELFPNYVVVLCPAPGSDPKQTTQVILWELLESLENNYGTMVQAIVSRPVTDLRRELSGAYAETEELYGFVRMIDSDRRIVFNEELTAGRSNLLNGDYLKQIQILTNTLIAGKYAVVPSMVEEILRDYVAPVDKDFPIARHRLDNVANLLTEAVRTGGVLGAETENAVERLQSAKHSVSELIAATGEVFQAVQQAEESASESEDAVSRACAYIRENLKNAELTIPMICEAAGVSVQHLSRLFRQRKNVTVVDYLNSERIKLAKTLLSDPSLTVAKIAEAVGYGSTETFSRNFRRREGLTPTEYRNLHSQ